MFWAMFITTAFASSTAGMGLTPTGGGLAGITEPGVMGLPTNPAAAKSASMEAAIDGGLSIYSLAIQLNGAAPVDTAGMVPLPYLGFTMPIHDFGIGVYVMVPYGGGADYPEDGAQRFHAIQTQGFLLETGLSVAYQPLEWLTMGASLRVGRGSLSKVAALDAASLINSKVTLDPPMNTGDPLFEGRQDLSLSGVGVGYGLGLTLTTPADYALHLGYRSPMRVPLSGKVTITPSNLIDLDIDGSASGAIQYAREFEIGLVIPAGETRIAVSGGYVDWSPLAIIDVTVTDLKLSSSDDSTDALIVETAINESGLTNQDIEIHNDLGHGSTLHGGVAVAVPIGSRWLIRPGVFYAPTTLPSDAFHASIVDFSAVDLRLSGAYSPMDWLTIGLSIDHFLIPDRVIDDSSLSLDNAASTGRVLPSANGRYQMSASRVGLTLIARL
jgi:long-subunit fatty acid transport protein